MGTSDTGQSQTGFSGDDSVPASSTRPPETLFGAASDPLIPQLADIKRVFEEGHETWKRFIKSAEALPPNSFPRGLTEPSIMLKDMPALPRKMPRVMLAGQPVWYLPIPKEDLGTSELSSEIPEEWHVPTPNQNLEHICGPQKELLLSYAGPIKCPPMLPSDGRPSAGPKGLSILTLMWAYIFSARLLESQGRNIRYSPDSLRPNVTNAECRIAVRLPARSPELVRWVCALLAPKPGWSAVRGGYPPWAAFCSGPVRFAISTDHPVAFNMNCRPPSYAEALELLIEFCSLFGLGPEEPKDNSFEPLSPPIAAFLAALSLPFYRRNELKPQFCISSLEWCYVGITRLKPLRQYAADLRYYMTLSLDPRSLGSVLWSIFWQPDVECNLVSPWLGSILAAIRPLVDSQDWEMLAKVFILRRPRVALWWLGIFLLGDSAIFGWISRYLETLEERWGFASGAPPDIAVAVWTGSPQSFVDEESSGVYPESTDIAIVPRADLLRHRYNLSLRDMSSTRFSWRPFGEVCKSDIELFLWPWLEREHKREYLHWIWVKADKLAMRDVQVGFRKETRRFIADIPDHLEMMGRQAGAGSHEDIKLAPSREATLRMTYYCLEGVGGDVDTKFLPSPESHPWLKGWRGLETTDEPIEDEAAEERTRAGYWLESTGERTRVEDWLKHIIKETKQE